VRSGRPDPPSGLVTYFERTLLDYPWADAEIPSLVHLDAAGSIVAFQGSHVRRARFDGHPIRVACAGQLVAHPDARASAVGALLVRAYLQGPQDLTITDGATEQMRQMWTLLGGEMAHLSCISWTRVLRPWRFAFDRLMHARGRQPGAARQTLAMLDRASTKVGRLLPPPSAPDVSAERLTPSALIEHLPLIGDHVRLCPAYDDSYLEWLFGELAAVTVRGTLIAHLVREPRRARSLGWYVYYLQPAGTAQVLQIAAADRDVGPVLDHLLHHAWSGGAAAVRGRVEPRLLEPLARRRCVLHFTGDALMHSANQEILGAVASGNSLLTRLDGEWWMGHHVLAFRDGA
jgi:hypothetical protein